MITKGIENKDVMEGGSGSRKYQIFQGRMGKETLYIGAGLRLANIIADYRKPHTLHQSLLQPQYPIPKVCMAGDWKNHSCLKGDFCWRRNHSRLLEKLLAWSEKDLPLWRAVLSLQRPTKNWWSSESYGVIVFIPLWWHFACISFSSS